MKPIEKLPTGLALVLSTQEALDVLEIPHGHVFRFVDQFYAQDYDGAYEFSDEDDAWVHGFAPRPPGGARYEIGDEVWVASSEEVKETIDCPDCLGGRTWSIQSPAGEEFRMSCPRCHGAGRLSRSEVRAVAREVAISSVKESASFPFVAYETAGSYGGRFVFTSREEALAFETERLRIWRERNPVQRIDELAIERMKWTLTSVRIEEARKRKRDVENALESVLDRVFTAGTATSILDYRDVEPKLRKRFGDVVGWILAAFVGREDAAGEVVRGWIECDTDMEDEG